MVNVGRRVRRRNGNAQTCGVFGYGGRADRRQPQATFPKCFRECNGGLVVADDQRLDGGGRGQKPPRQAVEAVAQLAIAIAARAPEKVGKLVLIAGTTSFIQRDGWPHAMAPEMLADFATGVAADIEAMLPRFVGGFNRGDARAKAVTSELLELADARPSAATLATGLNWLRDIDLYPLASQIKAPTLLMHGANDPLMPLAAAEALTALIPGAELAVFAECAHAPFLSQPEAFNTRLSNFINA